MRLFFVRACILSFFIFHSPAQVYADRNLDEEDRLREYDARGYQWPIPQVNPNTEGWRKIFYRRMEQLNSIEDVGERYNGWIQTISAALVAPNFTESGYV